MYIFSGQAVANEVNRKYRAENRHAFLAFASAKNQEVATENAIRELSNGGWKLITIERTKIISDDPDSISDATLKNAARSAQNNGCGIVIYEEPINE